MSRLLVAITLAACRSASTDATAPPDAGVDGCALLFGTPSDKTGLGSDQCRPRCECGGDAYAPPVYGPAFIKSLVDDWRLATPYPEILVDPYTLPVPASDPPGTVCGALPLPPADAGPRSYDLVTYPSTDAVRAAGARPTHFGRCGVCSPLADLAVYIRENDLGARARTCALSPDGGEGQIACLMALGFDHPCAQAWAYDAENTRARCLGVCLSNLTATYNQADGTLNPCIQCDEDMSGPVFASVAGRTRRNSGVPNAICRPCDQVRPLIHEY